MRNAQLLVLTAALLAACATPPEQIHRGMASDQVSATMGPPVYEVRLSNTLTRKFYRDDISMVRTWRADFDEKGRLVDFAPATTSTEFAEVAPGWTRSEVLEKFGEPDRLEQNPGASETYLVYRYRDYGERPAYMYITLDRRGTVLRVESMQIIQRKTSSR